MGYVFSHLMVSCCCSTFRGHDDSIIKRLVKKHANKERYKININYNKRPKKAPWRGWNFRLHVQCWFTHANV